MWLFVSLQWCDNERDGVSNHRRLECLLNRLFRRRSKKTSNFASLALVRWIHWGPGNSPYTWPVTRKMFPFDDVIMFPTKINEMVDVKAWAIWKVLTWIRSLIGPANWKTVTNKRRQIRPWTCFRLRCPNWNISPIAFFINNICSKVLRSNLWSSQFVTVSQFVTKSVAICDGCRNLWRKVSPVGADPTTS